MFSACNDRREVGDCFSEYTLSLSKGSQENPFVLLRDRRGFPTPQTGQVVGKEISRIGMTLCEVDVAVRKFKRAEAQSTSTLYSGRNQKGNYSQV